MSVPIRAPRRDELAALVDIERAAVTLTTFRDVPWNAPSYARLGFAVVEAADQGPEPGLARRRGGRADPGRRPAGGDAAAV